MEVEWTLGSVIHEGLGYDAHATTESYDDSSAKFLGITRILIICGFFIACLALFALYGSNRSGKRVSRIVKEVGTSMSSWPR